MSRAFISAARSPGGTAEVGPHVGTWAQTNVGFPTARGEGALVASSGWCAAGGDVWGGCCGSGGVRAAAAPAPRLSPPHPPPHPPGSGGRTCTPPRSPTWSRPLLLLLQQPYGSLALRVLALAPGLPGLLACGSEEASGGTERCQKRGLGVGGWGGAGQNSEPLVVTTAVTMFAGAAVLRPSPPAPQSCPAPQPQPTASPYRTPKLTPQPCPATCRHPPRTSDLPLRLPVVRCCLLL